MSSAWVPIRSGRGGRLPTRADRRRAFGYLAVGKLIGDRMNRASGAGPPAKVRIGVVIAAVAAVVFLLAGIIQNGLEDPAGTSHQSSDQGTDGTLSTSPSYFALAAPIRFGTDSLGVLESSGS